MNDLFKIALIQDSASANKAQNLESAKSRIREAAANGAQIICLKELFATPYFCTTEDTEKFSLAEEITGETNKEMQALAKELSLIHI